MMLLIIAAGSMLGGCGYNFTYSSRGNFLDREDAFEYKVKKSVVDPITTINIETGLGEVELIESDNYYVEIDYLYWEEKPDYSISDGKLTFDDSRAFPNSYSINFHLKNKIKIYLPEGADMKDVIIKTASGDVTIEGFIADELDVSVAYGNFTMKKAAATDAEINLSSGTSKISDFQATSLDFNNSYGNSSFTNINTGEKLLSSEMLYDSIKIIMSSGDVKINNMKSSSIEINNSYGDVTADTITADEFDTDLSSGDLDISEADMKDIDVSDSYGDVNLGLIGPDTDYSLDLTTSYGGIRVGNKKYEDHYDTDGGSRKVSADLSSGNIKLHFE